MKEISIKIDDELYRRASGKVEDLEAINGDDDGIMAARDHMADLFQATTNFGVGVGPSREEMQERGRIHLTKPGH